MKTSTTVLALFTLILGVAAYAEEQIIAVPGEGWRIRFDAPKLAKLAPRPGIVQSVFFGRADRFQLSFFVEPPRCLGGDSNQNIYACFAQALRQNPYVLWDTERANTVSNGVYVTYISRIEREGRVGTSVNINLLFSRNGKWADVHASIASPVKEDVNSLYAIMDSVKIEDDPAATERSSASVLEGDKKHHDSGK